MWLPGKSTELLQIKYFIVYIVSLSPFLYKYDAPYSKNKPYFKYFIIPFEYKNIKSSGNLKPLINNESIKNNYTVELA